MSSNKLAKPVPLVEITVSSPSPTSIPSHPTPTVHAAGPTSGSSSFPANSVGVNGVIDSSLIDAVKAGSVAEVRKLLVTSPSVTSLQRLKMLDYKDAQGRTALHYAALEGKVRIVLLLLEQDGCMVDPVDNEGNTPAHLAIKNERDGMVVWLSKKGADLKRKLDSQGKSVWDYTSPKLRDILKQYESSLLAAPLSNMRSKSMRAEHTALLEACHAGDLERVKQMLDNPGSSLRKMIDDRGLEGKNPLHIACEAGNVALADFLLSLGADPNREEEYMNVPLTISVTCYKGDPALVRTLLKHHAKVNTKSMFGLVPLIIASENGYLDVVRLLVESNADVNSDDNAGNTALHLAAQEGHLEICKYLLDHGGDVNRKNEVGQTPLEVAMPKVRKFICEKLGLPYKEEEVMVSVIEKSKSSGSLEVALGKEYHFDWKEVDLQDKIGAGSFGAVFLAYWKGKKVAIKKLNATNPSSLRMAKNEIHAMKGAIHPNVVTFFAACLNKEDYSIMTELMSYGSLGALVHKQRKPFTAFEITHYGLCIAKGMQYLHETRRIVHRDLRVDNILLTEEGDRVVAKVADFGLACDISLLNKRGQMRVGSLRWMAPEVFLGGDAHLTPKIDVYSFGILLWEMIANEVPFFTEAPLQVAQMAAEQQRRPSIPMDFHDQNPELVTLLQKCWDGDVGNRLSFGDVVALLEPLILKSSCVGSEVDTLPAPIASSSSSSSSSSAAIDSASASVSS